MSSSLSQALSLHWAYGFSKDKIHAVHSLCTKDRNALLLMSSHSGVIYDYEHRTQTILQGHCNIISCCVVDKNKRWIVTADSGTDSILVVWDAIACVPIKTYSVPHDNGIDAIDFSNDSLYLVTLSSPYRDDYLDQEIAIWAWTTDSNEPILRQRIQSNDMHTSVRFNPMKSSQIVSTGTKSISFWHWDEFNLDSYFGKVSKADLGNYSGSFVTTTYLKGTETALTATSDGYVIVWETQFEMKKKNHDPNNSAHNFMKKATKVLRLVECGINVMTTTDNEYLVIGCADGSVRFYDFFLRAEAWYEDLSAGAINAISFSIQNCPYPSGEAGAPGLKFWVSDFIVATADAFVIGVESSIFDEVRAEDRRGTLLMQGMANTVTGVSCHPSGPLVALNCSSGVIQVWNYDLKLLMNLREFNDRAALAVVTDERTNYLTKGDKKAAVFMQSTCLSYDATGRLLAVGFDNGTIKLLDSETLADFATIVPASDAILSIHFSPSGNYFACNDSNNHLLLFERTKDEEEGENAIFASSALPDYNYIGRCKSHKDSIVSVLFGVRENLETLVSVSTDKTCVEYDLGASSISTGVVCVKMYTDSDRAAINNNNFYYRHQIELDAHPTAALWHPQLGDDFEDRFVVANDKYKLKELNIESKLCRRTTLAPRFGNPISQILNIPAPPTYNDGIMEQKSRTQAYYAFSTGRKVIGVGSLPLTGNPSKIMGIVAHPNEVTSIAVSFDGNFVFSTGGKDLTANMWKINLQDEEDTAAMNNIVNQSYKRTNNNYLNLENDEGDNLQSRSTKSSDDLKAFYTLLEGGQDGELHRDIIDYFYYCELRHLGEETMDKRQLKGTIPLEEIPSLFRAVGFYPSEEEVLNIMNEVKYRHFSHTGTLESAINLEDLIKLYLNHRPVLPLDKQLINGAFTTIAQHLNFPSTNTISWDALQHCLLNEGEPISNDDLNAFLVALTGANSDSISPDSAYNAKIFSEQLLGFEDFQSNDW